MSAKRELHLSLLGGMQITLDGVPTTDFISSKAPALLCYLAVIGRVQSRQALAGLLWGDVPDSNARASLRTVLWDLRQHFASHLIITRDSAAFNRDAPYWLDVEAFRQYIEDGLRDTAQEKLTEGQVAALEQAVALYRGDLLEGFYVSDAPLFEEWVVGERERLRQAALRALHTLSAHYVEQGAHHKGIETTARLLTLEPWLEEGHQQLMRLLALSGRRGAALAQYETCRRILREELNVEPMPETTALYEQIRRSTGSQLDDFTPPKHNLPPQLTPFIGRRRELSRLRELLQDPHYRLVTLVGPGGVGKTRLALKAAQHLVDQFAHGVWIVPLVEVGHKGDSEVVGQGRDLISPAVADALHFPFSGQRPPRDQLLDYLRRKRLLLLLDNLEHVVDEGADFAVEVLREAPNVTLLITSRHRLNLQSEYVMRLEGLPVPEYQDLSDLGDLGEVLTYSSLRLFSERADRTSWGFSLDLHNLPDVAKICRLVDGLPLGIELAAAWVEELSPAEIAYRIDQNLDYLITAQRDVPMRHRSIRAVLESSYQLLSRRERIILAQLSVFRGGFTSRAAAAVADASDSDLRSLLGKSLLSRIGSGRYEMHEWVRKFAAERLRQGPPDSTDLDTSRIERRHSLYYLDFLAQREAGLHGERPRRALVDIQREWENVKQAWCWAVSQTNGDPLERSLSALYRFLRLKGWFQMGELLVGAGIERIGISSELTESQRTTLRRLLIRQASLLNDQANYTQAMTTAQTAIEMAQDNPMARLEAAARLEYGRALLRRGKYALAQEQIEQALNWAGDMDGRATAASAHHLLGDVAEAQENHSLAQSQFEHALRLFRGIGDRLGESQALNALGVVAAKRGDYSLGQFCFEQALDLYQTIGHLHGEGKVYNNLGCVADTLGDYATAKMYQERALRICRELGDRGEEIEVLVDLALLLHHLGDNEAARSCSQEAVQLARMWHYRTVQGEAWTSLGHALARLEEWREATDAYTEALTLQRELGRLRMALEPLAGLARVALAQGDLSRAQSYAEEILEYFESGGNAEGTREPIRIYLSCYRVLRASQDSRADAMLEKAHALLQQRADRMEDQELRHSFLENVVAHRELLREWAAMG